MGQIHPPFLKGHKYLIIAMNYFTTWVGTIPFKNLEQIDGKFIEENIVNRFGIPEIITTGMDIDSLHDK